MQARQFGPQVRPEPSTHIVKTKKSSVEAPDTENLSEDFLYPINCKWAIYNAGDRCVPRSRRFVEFTCQEALENARRKTPSMGISATTCRHQAES